MNTQTSAAVTGSSEIEAVVARAASVLPRFFPLDAFVASNPLHDFEQYRFEDAARSAPDLFGGQTLMPLAWYRQQLRTGAIDESQLRRALQVACPPDTLTLAGRSFSREALLWHHLTVGFGTDADADHAIPADWQDAAAAAVAGAGVYTEARRARRWEPARDLLTAWLDRCFDTGLTGALEQRVIGFLQSYLFPDAAALALPARDQGMYASFRALLAHDDLVKRARRRKNQPPAQLLPEAATQAIASSLEALNLAGPAAERYLRRHLVAIKGWASFIYTRGKAAQREAPATLSDLLAMQLVLERLMWEDLAEHLQLEISCEALLQEAGQETIPPDSDGDTERLARAGQWLGIKADALSRAAGNEVRALLACLRAVDDTWLALRFLEASEHTYGSRLLSALAGSGTPDAGTVADAQLVFCIDVRSEPFRAALEAQGNYSTYGYAGFFGLPIAFRHLDGSTTSQCPVLIAPTHAVADAYQDDADQGSVHRHRRQLAAGKLKWAIPQRLKTHPLAGFGLVEAVGLASAWSMVRDALKLNSPAPGTSGLADPDLSAPVAGLPALSEDEQFSCARSLFALTGFSAPFARLVVLCAHGGASSNNPYAAALDCGACGGHEGGPNARVMAAILNRPEIRARLAAEGIEIPDDTCFVAARHNTTTDEVTLFDRERLPASHEADLASLEAALIQAGASNRIRRGAQMNAGADAVRSRSQDAAEVRPEWGLARNAAFIVAPRERTLGAPLAGRAFLHSYDWRVDDDGSLLETIMTAPMIVAQWINSQYYFSTVDNATFGSGSKTTQNVVGGCAIMQGNQSDLRLGLPLQSVLDEDGQPFHEPQRLLVVIEAPLDKVTNVIKKHEQVARLFDNEWLMLSVLDPDTGHFYRYQSGGYWYSEAVADGS